jgi:predicted ATPase
LATSRVPLRLRAEREYPVPPLGLPRRKPPPTLEQLTQYEAVHLFIDRAQAVKPNFAVDNANAPAIAEICHRLDGLPLAIELAAARIRMLSPPAMLARLEQRLPLLTGGARDAPERQRALRNTIAWSYDLLEPEDQVLFRRLAVFAGGATFEAAEAVADPEGQLDVFGRLERLLEQSLLRQDEGLDGEPRFSMLETIREFGLERLKESGEAEEVRQRHAEYFLALAEEAAPALRGQGQQRWLDRLEVDLLNLRSALGWTLEHEPATALRLAAALWRFWDAHSHLREGQAWLAQVLALGSEADASTRVKALEGAAELAWEQGDYPRAVTLAEEGLRLARALGDRTAVAAALQSLAITTWSQDGSARVRDLLEESLVLYREAGDAWGQAHTLNNLGYYIYLQGDPAGAVPLLEEAVGLWRHLGDRRETALTLHSLADTLRALGDTAAASALYRESLTLACALGFQLGVAACLLSVAELAMVSGQAERAAHLLVAAEALREAFGLALEAPEHSRRERAVDAVRAALGDTTFKAAWEAGRALTPEEAVAEALRLVEPAPVSAQVTPLELADETS